jgi:hypothetical protein
VQCDIQGDLNAKYRKALQTMMNSNLKMKTSRFKDFQKKKNSTVTRMQNILFLKKKLLKKKCKSVIKARK